jgi:hypothetical protein
MSSSVCSPIWSPALLITAGLLSQVFDEAVGDGPGRLVEVTGVGALVGHAQDGAADPQPRDLPGAAVKVIT